MSALSREADMLIVGINVCQVPDADPVGTFVRVLHLKRAAKQRLSGAEIPRCLPSQHPIRKAQPLLRGHPLHPMLIPFPIAFFVFAFLARRGLHLSLHRLERLELSLSVPRGGC
jgi:hypothetical protein